MAHVEAPACPADDLDARGARRGATFAGGTLTPDPAAPCQKGVSVILATCAGGRPMATRGFACRIDDTGTVRILPRGTGQEAFLAAQREGAAIAATFTLAPQHRSIQLQGRSALTA